jgi:hypothetical protein
MTTTTEVLEGLLSNEDCPQVAALYSWSTNYDPGQGPSTLFLDLIGWSEEEFGAPCFDHNKIGSFGYVELAYLADALKAYADNPSWVRSYVDDLMVAERQEED